jgi:hypothetical protein
MDDPFQVAATDSNFSSTNFSFTSGHGPAQTALPPIMRIAIRCMISDPVLWLGAAAI